MENGVLIFVVLLLGGFVVYATFMLVIYFSWHCYYRQCQLMNLTGSLKGVYVNITWRIL